MTSLRVLHVIPAVAARYGGPSVAVRGMCTALRAAGHHVVVATTDADGDGRLHVPLVQQTTYDGLETIFFPRQLSESFKWSAPLARWLRRHVADFDVVHVHAVFSHASLAAGRACRSAGVPYIVRPLGTLDPWSLSRHRWRKRALLLAGGRRLLQGASAIHYTAADEQRRAISALPWLTRGVVVPLAVDDEFFADDVPATRDIALIMCRLDPKKGIELAIDAFHDLVRGERDRGVTLVVAGDGAADYRRALVQRAANGPARDRIAFAGWVAGDTRLTLFRRARLFLLPSQQENFGLAAVEAMACGTPVMVSPAVDIASELAGSGAAWVIPRDPLAWSEAVAGALVDEDERSRRGENARRWAAQFRWPATATRLHAIYERMLLDRDAHAMQGHELHTAPGVMPATTEYVGSAHRSP